MKEINWIDSLPEEKPKKTEFKFAGKKESKIKSKKIIYLTCNLD